MVSQNGERAGVFASRLEKNKMDALTAPVASLPVLAFIMSKWKTRVCEVWRQGLSQSERWLFSVAAGGTPGCTSTALMSVPGLIIDRKGPESMPFGGAASLTV